MNRKRWLIAVLVVAASLSFLLPAPAVARPLERTTVKKDDDLVIITVPIDVRADPGLRFRNQDTGQVLDPEGLADFWEPRIEMIWNEGMHGLKYRGCYSLRVDVDIDVIPPGANAGAGRHQVDLMNSRYRSRVFRGGGVGKNEDDSNPYQTSATGKWGPVFPRTAAHETGHFLGFGDDYTQEAGRPAEPLPGRDNTMMANHTDGDMTTWFDQTLVDRLGDMVDEQVDLPPCILGLHEGTEENEEGGRRSTETGSYIIEIKPDENMTLQGKLSGDFSVSGTVEEGDCSFSWSTGATIELDLKVSGSDDGPYTIETDPWHRIEETQRHFLCDQPIDYKIEWDVGFAIADVVFENGRFEREDEMSRTVMVYKDSDEE